MYDANAVYFDPILTDFSVGYQPAQLVGTELFPLTSVSLPSGKYRVFDRSSWLYPRSTIREPGTVAHEVQGRKWSEDTYFANEHALQAPVTDEERANLGANGSNPANAALFAGIAPMEDATALVTTQILIELEKTIADKARTTGNYPAGNFTTLSGTSQWSDYSGTSDPVKDIEAAIRQVFSKIYLKPNLMIIPWIVWSYLRNHPKIVDRVKSFRLSTQDAFQELTGFEGRIVIPESVYNSADNVDLTESPVEIWGKDVVLARVDASNEMNTQTFAKTFYMPYPDGSTRAVDRWREEPRKSDIVRVGMKYDTKIVSNSAGYVIKAAVA